MQQQKVRLTSQQISLPIQIYPEKEKLMLRLLLVSPLQVKLIRE